MNTYTGIYRYYLYLLWIYPGNSGDTKCFGPVRLKSGEKSNYFGWPRSQFSLAKGIPMQPALEPCSDGSEVPLERCFAFFGSCHSAVKFANLSETSQQLGNTLKTLNATWALDAPFTCILVFYTVCRFFRCQNLFRRLHLDGKECFCFGLNKNWQPQHDQKMEG